MDPNDNTHRSSLPPPIPESSFNRQSSYDEREAIPLKTISEHTEPLSPSSVYFGQRSTQGRTSPAVIDGFGAFRAIALYNIDLRSIYGIPSQLHECGMSEDMWQKFVEVMLLALHSLLDIDSTM